ncbi:MAG: DNA replication and repair protein RecF [Cyclobacteriaceae bacterium]|nr:DNA replication and repair protein RecF [Cyclobacteriaceae bacterium]
MQLEKLSLVNFKNYQEARLDFEGPIQCFLGKNGSGKTNLLEAIHYLAFTRGSSFVGDAHSAREGTDQFLIKGFFTKHSKVTEVTCSFEGRKKTIFENSKPYTRFSEHIGKYPLVLVAPNDIELIWDGGEIRRKFFDALLSQLDKEYLDQLVIYQAYLKQRNSLLRMFAERGTVDLDLVGSYNEKLAASGEVIFQKRQEFISQFLPQLEKRYAFLIEGAGEKISVEYNSELKEIDFKKELEKRLDRDIALGRTSVGIHRDDFHFLLNGHDLRRFGSQGQQKSFLIAMKLAEFDCLSAQNGFKPLLLLDDIFDKLDNDRIQHLMSLVSSHEFGQIFITDARPDRSLEIIKASGIKAQNFNVENGRVSSL